MFILKWQWDKIAFISILFSGIVHEAGFLGDFSHDFINEIVHDINFDIDWIKVVYY